MSHIDSVRRKGIWVTLTQFEIAALSSFTQCGNVERGTKFGGLMGSDYQAGLGAGMARARAVRADANSAVSDWASFAQDLKGKLLTESVERQVSVEYVRQLRAALREADPKHPLLQDAVAEQLFERTRIAAFEQNGFQYNPSTGRFLKR